MDIPRNEQINIAISIVVAPSGPGAEAPAAHARLFGHVLELAVAQVAIEGIATVTRHEEVELAVVVVIRHCHSHAPAAPRQPRFLRDVLKSAIRLLMIQRDERVATVPRPLDGGTVYHHDVQTAVIVAIEQTDPAAHGLDDIPLVRRRDMRCPQAQLRGDILEFGNRGKAGAVRPRFRWARRGRHGYARALPCFRANNRDFQRKQKQK